MSVMSSLVPQILSPTVFAISYCALISTIFVGSLYVLVPRHIRHLPRNDERQVKWRICSSVMVSLIATLSFPLLFLPQWKLVYFQDQISLIPLWHSMILYFGPLLMAVCRIHARNKINPKVTSCIRQILLGPLGDHSGWILIRNFAIAPLTEEMLFRGCIVKALLWNGIFSVAAVAWIAPLFFGSSHLHHVYQLIAHEKYPLNFAWKIVAFQFVYTTLFGAYVSHCYIRTGSLSGVILSHSFCNIMGLPNFSFYSKRSEVYGYRYLITFAYAIGIAFFIILFDSKHHVFPKESILPKWIKENQ